MIIGSTFPVTVSIVASDNPICESTQVTFTAYSNYGGPSPAYQWKRNGTDVGTNSPVYICFPAEGDVITCSLTSQLTCAAVNPVTSNAITMAVLPVPVSVTIGATPPGSVCAGTLVTFTSFSINGGPIPTYLWKVNGSAVGVSSTTYTYPPQNGDAVTCTLTSNATCAVGNTVTSVPVYASVMPGLPVSIIITAIQGNSVCEGNPVTFSASAINEGGNPLYNWKVNGFDAGSNSPFFIYTPVQGDVIRCILTSDATCATGSPSVSNDITMTVHPNLPVSLVITASPPGAVCASTPVTFTAAPVNGGTIPSFQWKVTGVNAGNNSPGFLHTPIDGEIITCEVTSGATCPVGSPATSNSIVMAVNQILPASVSITASTAGAICAGTVMTCTATDRKSTRLNSSH